MVAGPTGVVIGLVADMVEGHHTHAGKRFHLLPVALDRLDDGNIRLTPHQPRDVFELLNLLLQSGIVAAAAKGRAGVLVLGEPLAVAVDALFVGGETHGDDVVDRLVEMAVAGSAW